MISTEQNNDERKSQSNLMKLISSKSQAGLESKQNKLEKRFLGGCGGGCGGGGCGGGYGGGYEEYGYEEGYEEEYVPYG